MAKKLFALFIVVSILMSWLYVSTGNGEQATQHLIVRDNTGSLSDKRISELTSAAQVTLDSILQFWSTSARVKKYGKIRVELKPPRKGTYTSVFLWEKRNGERVRVVKIFGVKEQPHMMAHKLTHAVFPNRDKLVRNMMGVPMEIKFGNPQTFPMCGFSNDDWVSAFIKAESYIPLTELGSDHTDWGMRTKGGLPIVVDKARQHTAYAESGSFGAYLLNSFGMAKIKKFNKLSSNRKKRPWVKIFGSSLKELEADWQAAVKATEHSRDKNISILLRLLKDNPNTAYLKAQSIAMK